MRQHRLFKQLLVVAALPLAFAAASAQATVVYGVQTTALGSTIVTVDPTTGTITNTYATPDTVALTQGYAGLTYAAGLNQLLYTNSANSNTVYRIDPTTGRTIATATGIPTQFAPIAGLSYENLSGTNYIYYGHQNVDVHRQAGFGGAQAEFFNQPTGNAPQTPNPTAGLGGDGYGREFLISSNGIFEYNASTGALINNLSQFTLGNTAVALGLAFDGNFLYASTSLGTLLTLNPNTGALIQSVIVSNGLRLLEIGARGAAITAAVPEPESVALLGLGLVGLCMFRRRGTKPAQPAPAMA